MKVVYAAALLTLAVSAWVAFFPVALISLLGRTVCSISQGLSAQMCVGQLTAELVQDLVCADQHNRELVLAYQHA